MKWFGIDDDGRRRVAGIPVSEVWRGNPDALLDGFEPENPHILIARRYGLGWGINLGAVAVKAGWIRPDDSLPDLAEYIPETVRRTLFIAPLLGGATAFAAAVAVAQCPRVASKYSLTGTPVKYSSGLTTAVVPLALTGAVAVLPRLLHRGTAQSQTAIEVSTQAETLGAQAMAATALLASYRSARKPESRQALAIASPLLWPLASGAVQIFCVKTALNAINAELASRHTES